MQRAVERGQERKEALPMPRVGIDEKAFAKGHKYVTLLYEIDNSTVQAIAVGRDIHAAKACFSQLSDVQINAIEAISMDMSASYVNAAKETIPLAEEKIVHDRFHVMQLASKAVDQVWRAEHKELSAEGDMTLARSRYIWLKGQENLTEKQRLFFDEAYRAELKTGKAWSYKEMLRDLWHHDDAAAATVYFQDWYQRVIHTNLTPLKKAARTIKQRLANVVSYCTHGITNAVAEGVNSKIMSIKRRVGGFRNIENFQTAIFFYCGGLKLHP
ncbi:Transposase [Lignipirellula cremea]|uniref:Transposase n=1 Tax=Lignipirellula cremea TaxID=2528010 RepID=A0A518DSC7_9BACT|nr:Transposase [Lignipirellula cremea]